MGRTSALRDGGARALDDVRSQPRDAGIEWARGRLEAPLSREWGTDGVPHNADCTVATRTHGEHTRRKSVLSHEEKTVMNDKKAPSAVRTSLGELAPKLVELTEDVLFGDVWERPQLSKRDRSLITCAALIATGKTEQMDFHFPNATKNGVTEDELIEMITHLAFYVGWPNAMSAVNRAKALFTKEEKP
jgi:4-carboxymuconolactone decarboxylase